MIGLSHYLRRIVLLPEAWSYAGADDALQRSPWNSGPLYRSKLNKNKFSLFQQQPNICLMSYLNIYIRYVGCKHIL